MSLTDDYDDGAPGADDRDWEAEARAMGWKPFEEYRGPPDKWREAQEFVEHAERTVPVMRDQLRRGNERNASLQNEVNTLKAQVEALTVTAQEARDAALELRKLAQRAEERGRKDALAELSARQREAVANGDTEEFDRTVAETERLQQQWKEEDRGQVPGPGAADPARPAQPAAVPGQAEINAWKQQNPWFDTDLELQAEMVAEHFKVARQNPGLSMAEQLAKAKERVVKLFPERFGQPTRARPLEADEYGDDYEEDELPPEPPAPRRRAAAPVAQPVARAPVPRQGARGFDRIADPTERAEARRAFETIRKFDPDITEAEYLATYLNPKADVLDVQARISRRRNSQ